MENKMTAKWMLQTKKADFDAIAGRYRISPVTARIIRNRDVRSEEEIRRYLTGTLDDLYDPHLLKDMDRAVEILKEKIRDQKRIRIVGDYDIDGVCSTYLLYKGLSRVNAAVDYEIPDRIKDGYGINESIIRDAYESGIDTILTCDNGISAISQIALAKDLGMTVIITDHHDIAEEDGKELIPQAESAEGLWRISWFRQSMRHMGFPWKNGRTFWNLQPSLQWAM